MKYYIGYGYQGPEQGANQAGHALVYFFKQRAKNKPLELQTSFGFYATALHDDKTFIERIQSEKLGINVDLRNSHGFFQEEDPRFMVMGVGIKGKIYQIPHESFDAALHHCYKMIANHNQVYAEIEQKHESRPSSKELFLHEIHAAEMQQREPRLRPFRVEFSFGFFNLNLAGSNNCKTEVLKILKIAGIVDPSLTVNGKYPALPRFSGKLETIYLHPRFEEITDYKFSIKTGRTHLIKSRKSVYALTPPQNVISDDHETLDSLFLKSSNSINTLISKLKRVCEIVENSRILNKHTQKKADLTSLLAATFTAFAENWQRDLTYTLEQAEQLISTIKTEYIYIFPPHDKQSIIKILEFEVKHKNLRAASLTDQLNRIANTLEHLQSIHKNKNLSQLHRHTINLYESFIQTKKPEYKSELFFNLEQQKQLKDIGIELSIPDYRSINGKIKITKLFFSRIAFAINDNWEDPSETETVLTTLPEQYKKLLCKIIKKPYDPAQNQKLEIEFTRCATM